MIRYYIKVGLNRLYFKSVNISGSSRYKRYKIDSLSYISLFTALNSTILLLLTSYTYTFVLSFRSVIIVKC